MARRCRTAPGEHAARVGPYRSATPLQCWRKLPLRQAQHKFTDEYMNDNANVGMMSMARGLRPACVWSSAVQAGHAAMEAQ